MTDKIKLKDIQRRIEHIIEDAELLRKSKETYEFDKFNLQQIINNSEFSILCIEDIILNNS